MNDDTRLRDGPLPCEDLQGGGALGPSGAVGAQPLQGRGNNQGTEQGTEIYAALDLGTNNCRLLIACPAGGGFRVVDSFSRIIRLGEGVSATGCISDAAIERAIAALSICRDKIQLRKARRLRLIATEACRAASNADGFRDRVAAETGIQLEVIDRET
jgi:exopolyphosphatase/guanosine-5'-triphosphate,3'-diphosphate pyrophosphatase